MCWSAKPNRAVRLRYAPLYKSSGSPPQGLPDFRFWERHTMMIPQNGLRSALPLSERSGERRANTLLAQGIALGLRVYVCFRAVSAKAPQVTDVYAFGSAFVRHDSAKRASTMALAAPSVAPVGRSFSCAILPRAMPWADSSLALQAALLATFVLPLPFFPRFALKAAEPSAGRFMKPYYRSSPISLPLYCLEK